MLNYNVLDEIVNIIESSEQPQPHIEIHNELEKRLKEKFTYESTQDALIYLEQECRVHASYEDPYIIKWKK